MNELKTSILSTRLKPTTKHSLESLSSDLGCTVSRLVHYLVTRSIEVRDNLVDANGFSMYPIPKSLESWLLVRANQSGKTPEDLLIEMVEKAVHRPTPGVAPRLPLS